MCGIFCSVSKNPDTPSRFQPCLDQCLESLKRRGPDSVDKVSVTLRNGMEACFCGSVLWTQGSTAPTKQPLIDTEGNILLWNGDVFGGDLFQEIQEGGCDSTVVLAAMKKFGVPKTLFAIQGPYSFVYLDRKNLYLWFGRDPVGRQSLLFSISDDGYYFTSVGSASVPDLKEVPAIGFCRIDLEENDFSKAALMYSWLHHLRRGYQIFSEIKEMGFQISQKIARHSTIRKPGFIVKQQQSPDCEFPFLQDSKVTSKELLKLFSEEQYYEDNVNSLITVLKQAVQVRVDTQPKMCSLCIKTNDFCAHGRTAILFSGGLDSTILALLCSEFVPENEPIDLFNVAFEKIDRTQKHKVPPSDVHKDPGPPLETFNVPDRMTGLNSLKELKTLCPERKWNFVEINVTRKELDEYREARISDLIYPLKSVLDDSLGCAVWFAARGQGLLNGEPYSSSARILVLGMGADELLGGYSRHFKTFSRHGWEALNNELISDVWNISFRNLGRDNRVASDHGRQPRFPFLDENVIKFLTSLPPWNRCWFPNTPPGVGDKLLLRLAALKLGLQSAAILKKKAIQFGSKIADSKEKGSCVSCRLTNEE